MPAILNFLGVTALPPFRREAPRGPADGVSVHYAIAGPAGRPDQRTEFFSLPGARGLWQDGWLAVATQPAISDRENRAGEIWELYYSGADDAEPPDLAAAFPEKVLELASLWSAEAGADEAGADGARADGTVPAAPGADGEPGREAASLPVRLSCGQCQRAPAEWSA